MEKNKDSELIKKLNKKWASGEITAKKAGGQTNRNWVVEHKGKKFFVRLPWETDVLNREIEAENILALSRNKKLKGILPKYYLYILNGRNILSFKKEKFDLPSGAMMMEYIPGKVFNWALFKKKDFQEKLARMFWIFHHSGVRFVNKYNVFFDELGKYRIAARKYPFQKIINSSFVEYLERIEKEADSMIPIGKGTPAHNDFILQNFLIGKNGKIYLLDFEYAGMNQKGGYLYDFAFLFADNFFRYSSSQPVFENFLEAADKIYGHRLDRGRIYWLSLAVSVMQIWWALLRYFDVSDQEEKEYFKDYIQKRTRAIKKIEKIAKNTSKNE